MLMHVGGLPHYLTLCARDAVDPQGFMGITKPMKSGTILDGSSPSASAPSSLKRRLADAFSYDAVGLHRLVNTSPNPVR
jgi:hypothetical protein